LMRLAAMGPPMLPRPMNPMCGMCVSYLIGGMCQFESFAGGR
jgi:hypothetical protein